jgi:hypothetical protein
MPRHALTALACTAFAGVASGQPIMMYSQDFQSGLGSGWSSNAAVVHEDGFTKFLGRYSWSNAVTLGLSQPAAAAGNQVVYNVTFDLYAIDSWDGDDVNNGPDRFEVKANGVTLLSETIANVHTLQSMREPDIARVHIGFNEKWVDSIYRDISLSFTVPQGQPMTLSFQSLGLLTMSDESWGIDNVRVSYEIVPAPAGAAAMALAGLLGIRRRR